VKIRSCSEKNRVLILLGSNLMDPYSSISDAIDILKNEVQLIKKGSVFCSNSWGYVGNDYLNQMIEVEWKDSLSDLMIFLLAVEKRMGRNRNLKSKDYEDRIIDLDIILWSEGKYSSKNLKVPHPRMADRRFVLVPLNEFWSDWIHPEKKKDGKELLTTCSDENLVHLYQLNEKNKK